MAVYLLSVGLNHYADRNIRAVHCCENDALEIYSLFSGTFGLGDRALCLTGKVYSHQVWDALQNIGNTIRNGDTLIFFFAGHGHQKPDSRDQLLLLHNAYLDLLDTASPDGTIALSALKARTDQWRGVSRVFILDACRSNILEGFNNRGAKEVFHNEKEVFHNEKEVFHNEDALIYLSTRDLTPALRKADEKDNTDDFSNIFILNATRNGERACELETLGRGTMAYALEKVLRLRHQQGQPVWLDKKLVGEVAHKIGELFYESGISSVKQTPFLTPPNGRVLLHKPQAGNNNNIGNDIPPPPEEPPTDKGRRKMLVWMGTGGALLLGGGLWWAMAPQPNKSTPIVPVEPEKTILPIEDLNTDEMDKEIKTISSTNWQPKKEIIEVPSVITSLAVLADSKHAVSGHADGRIRLWDLSTGETVHTSEKGHTDWIRSIAVTPDGGYVFSGSDDKTVRQWSLPDCKLVRTFEGHTNWVRCVAITPDGRHLLSGSLDKTIRKWSLEDGTEEFIFRGHTDLIRSIVVTPDGSSLLSGSKDNTIRKWSLAGGKEIFKVYTDSVYSIASISDGDYFLSGGTSNMIRKWSLIDGKLVQNFTGHTDTVLSIAVTPDGRYLLSGSNDKTIQQWSLVDGEEIHNFKGHRDIIWSIVVTSDGRYAISGSKDRTLRLWSL